MTASDKIRATAYLIIRADVTGNGQVRAAKISASRQSRPDLAWNEVAVRVSIDLPRSIFERITPEAVIDVPDDIVVHPVITATVGEPEVSGDGE